MLVLVSMRAVENSTYPESRDAISHDWTHLLQKQGLLPIYVPNELDDPSRYFGLGADALLLTGGENLGDNAQLTSRDRTEEKLLSGAMLVGMPIFGTCRGLQTLNRYFGGRVTRQLPEAHVGNHDVQLSSGETCEINSFHNEGVMRDGVAPDFDVFAATKSGVVEGMRHRDLPIIAIQWHPERPNPMADLDHALMQDWLSKCV